MWSRSPRIPDTSIPGLLGGKKILFLSPEKSTPSVSHSWFPCAIKHTRTSVLPTGWTATFSSTGTVRAVVSKKQPEQLQ